MSKVIGIGGVFLGFKGEVNELHNWYEKHLGLLMSDYGANFVDGEQLALVSFKRGPKENVPFINFRVDDIQTMINHLQAEGCEIIQPIATYPYGKFAQFIDPFGNPVELWEAYRDEYIKMGEEELKKRQKS